MTDSLAETGKILDAANSAREASPADKKSFWMTGIYIGAFLVGIVAAFIAGAVWYKTYSKEAPIARSEAPAVVAPVVTVKPSVTKPAVKPAQKSAVKESAPVEPAMPEIKSTVKILQPDPLAPALAEFEKRVLNFESKL